VQNSIYGFLGPVLENGTLVAGCMVACVLVSASGAIGTLVLTFVRFVPAVSAFVLCAGAVPVLTVIAASHCWQVPNVMGPPAGENSPLF
jgi:hypothetical protein